MLYDCTAHLDGGVACFGIHPSCMGHADDKVNIAHYFGEHLGVYLTDVFIVKGTAVVKRHIFECRRFYVGWRKPVGHGIHHGGDVAVEAYFLETVLVIHGPLTLFEHSDGACRHYLIACITQRFRLLFFLFYRDIQFTEHLLEGLAHLPLDWASNEITYRGRELGCAQV